MSLFCVSTININIDTCTIFRVTINWSDRIKQLLGKGRDVKRLVTKKKHAVQDEAALAKKLLDAVRPADGHPEYRTYIKFVETQNSDTFSFCTN